VETGASFIPGVGPALAARDFERARRADDPAGMAMAAASAIPGERLAKLLGKFDPTRLELDVYHGTPHRFPATEANPLGEFDASKIGTGEGAQSYGHGIYLAEKPEIAKYYKNTIQVDPEEFVDGQKFDELNPEHLAAYYAAGHMKVRKGRFNPEEAANFIADRTDEPHRKAAELLRKGKFGKYTETEPGALYKADLPDEMIDRMLDWDKPLSQQPAAVRNLFPTVEEAKTIDAEMIRLSEAALAANDINSPAQAAWDAMYKSPRYRMARIVVDETDPKLRGKFANGQEIYRAISGGNEKAASEQLKSMGIPGIKYLDAGSRGQGGAGTRNFVVFPGEEKKVRILERK